MIWDVSTGNLVKEWTQEYAKMPGPRGPDTDYEIPVYAFAFVPVTTSLVLASGNALEIRDLLQDQKWDELRLGDNMYATQISLSPDGRLAYIIMSWEKDHDFPAYWTHQHKFQSWNLETHELTRENNYPEGWVNLDLQLLGSKLVEVYYDDATSNMVNLETNEVQGLPFRRGWRSFNSDGSLMVSARLFGFEDEDRAIELWNTDNWRKIYSFMPDFGLHWIYGLHGIAFSPGNTILAIAHQEQVTLWYIDPVLKK